jgi:dephospho-CoA kinase
MPYILGLTGSIACGKTTVGLHLLELGADVYLDADQVVHELYLPGQPLVPELASVFGPEIVNAAGGIDRTVLGRIVFGNPEKLRLLESHVHPAVQNALLTHLREMAEAGPDSIGVLDAVKLVESGYSQLCHGVWVVTCPPEVQLERLMRDRGLSREDGQARLDAQGDIARKLAAATEIIDNSGDMPHLRAQVAAAWQRFTQQIGLSRPGIDPGQGVGGDSPHGAR